MSSEAKRNDSWIAKRLKRKSPKAVANEMVSSGKHADLKHALWNVYNAIRRRKKPFTNYYKKDS